MKSDWQPFEQGNDDGIDGFITFRKGGEVTGEVVFVQSKCYSSHQIAPNGLTDFIGLNIGKEYIQKHIPRWNKMIAPVIIIYTQYLIDDSKAISWWTDATDTNSYSENVQSYILIPKKQRFKGHSIGDLKKLCGHKQQDYNLPKIELTRNDVSLYKISSKIKDEARKYYTNWAKSDISERYNPTLGEIQITRVGWRHLTRKNRKTERIIQSWSLLGVAKRIIKEIKEPENINRSHTEIIGDWKIIKSYVILRAFVTFPHRYESSITVVIRKQIKINIKNGISEKPKHWFFSVYESRRGRTPKRLARGY